MNKDIKQLIESLYKFNPADYEEDLEDEVLDYSKKLIAPSIPELLYTVYNIDSIPNKWKTEKDPKTGFINLYYTYSNTYYGDLAHVPDVGKRLLSQLIVTGNFTEYHSSDEPYAYINKTDVHDARNGYGSQKSIQRDKRKLEEWKKEYKTFPPIVQRYFDSSPTYKTIWLSSDQGILILLETCYDTGFYARDYMIENSKVSIKLTGIVAYEIPEKIKDANKYKTFIKKQKFFDYYLTKELDYEGKVHTSGELKKYICKYFMVTKQNEPVYISFFNMDNMIELAQKNLRSKRIPTILEVLVRRGCNVLSQYERDDYNSKYELVKDCIHIYIYDMIPKNMEKFINQQTIILPHNTKDKSKLKDPDHLVIVKLDSYAEDMYNEIFNKQ